LENALVRAVRTGKLGFDDLKRVALSAMAEIGAAAIRSGIGAIGSGGGLGSLVAAAGQVLGTIFGAPGRALGGPVTPGRPYLVGERGPELFVPTASGRVETGRAAARDIRMSITVNAAAGEAPQALARSSRQVARAVRQALMRADD
jgi:phage-related minor tail protein